MKLWPPVTFPDVYCHLIDTPVNFTGEKLKAYNFVISGWVKSLQVLKRNSAYHSSDHSGNVSSSSVNGDIAFLWEWSNFEHS